jgi:hypothetical protein
MVFSAREYPFHRRRRPFPGDAISSSVCSLLEASHLFFSVSAPLKLLILLIIHSQMYFALLSADCLSTSLTHDGGVLRLTYHIA